ncbi:MAG: NADH-quinone oxidoreductase subunit C [Propionibacteriaceae bacterium]|jgi:NADH-quinone oxidoreductase subunit C|nr:NADH-quinone oxidoreductase subunit C [Propionibacteriaceae bacterium]
MTVSSESAALAKPGQPVLVATRKGLWSEGPGDVSGYGGVERPVFRHLRSGRPLGGWFDEVADRLVCLVPALGGDCFGVDRDELTVYVPRDLLPDVVAQCRDDAWLRFEHCVSVSGVHYPDEPGAELHSLYHLLSITYNRRLRLEVTCPEADPVIPSVVKTYPMADWHERETWDMFGIRFAGHPHLTRILMPDDWQGHPQRKDYPLGGIPIEFKGAQTPPPDERRSYS